MNKQLISHFTKFLLFLLIIFTLVPMIIALPTLAHEAAFEIYPEINYLHYPILILSELALLMFMIGCGIIIKLLFLFDKKETFTNNFTRFISYLIILCGLASVTLVIIYSLLANVGGPGPALSIVIIGALLCIIVLMSALYLIRHIIKEAIEMREERELTI